MAKLSRVIALTGSAVVAGMGFSADRGEKIFDDDKAVVQKEVEQCLEQGRFDVARALAKGNPELAKVVLRRSRAEKRAARRAKVARGIARRAKLAAEQKKVVEEAEAPRKGPPKFYEVQLNPKDRRTEFYEVRS
jgi:hypothetical protein